MLLMLYGDRRFCGQTVFGSDRRRGALSMASAKCQFVLGIILVVFLGTWHVSSAAEGTAEVLTPRDNLQIANAEKTCHLANLFLHSLADDDGVAEPIDIHPVDGGKVRKYAASLDYSVNGFHLLATASPRDSCKLDEISESSSAVMLDPGDARNLEIFVLAKHHNIDGLESKIANMYPFFVIFSFVRLLEIFKPYLF